MSLVEIKETGWTAGGIWQESKVLYFDHQPGDGTRYELLAVDLDGRGLHLGSALGYVSKDAIVCICGFTGRAYLFTKGDTISEFYIAEKFAITNPHSVHHYAELVAHAISGEVVGCDHLSDGQRSNG